MTTIQELNELLKPVLFGKSSTKKMIDIIKATTIDLYEAPLKDKNDGRQIIHFAVQWGVHNLIAALLDKGIDPNSRDSINLKTPLHYLVAKNGEIKIKRLSLDYLIRKGADINAIDINKETPLITLTKALVCAENFYYDQQKEQQKIELINNLVDLGADILDDRGAQAICYATKSPRAVQLLAKKGIPIQGKGSWIPLAHAARNGQLALVKWLLKHGATLKGETGQECLASAIAGKDLAIFILFIDKGVDVHTPYRGFTFLQRVINEENQSNWCLEEHVEFLLKKGVDPNEKGPAGNYPISMAGKTMKQLLLKHGANPKYLTDDEKKILQNQKLYNAIWSMKDPETAKQILLTEDIDVSIAPFGKGRLLLHYAAQFGLTDVIQLLIRKGADVNAVTDDGMTPLHCLAKSDNLNAIAAKILLEHNAQVKATTRDGKTAAQLAKAELNPYIPKALYNERETFIRLLKNYRSATKISSSEKLFQAAATGDISLFQKYAKPAELQKRASKLLFSVCEHADKKDERFEIAKQCIQYVTHVNTFDKKSKNTLLNLCACFNHPKIASLLLDYGADIDHANHTNQTPLLQALINDCNETVTLLVERGATIFNAIGVEYLNEAIYRKNKINAFLLMSAGVIVNGIGISNCTPLQIAVEQSLTILVQRLLDAGADPNIKTEKKTYPLAIAIKNCNEVITHLLLLNGADPQLSINKKLTIQDLAAVSKHSGITAMVTFTKRELKAYKPYQKMLRFVNRRLLFAEGIDRWGQLVETQVKKSLGMMTFTKIKEDSGEIEYFDVINESGKPVYQLLLFNYGHGGLFNHDKDSPMGYVVQHGFDLTKKIPASEELRLRELLDDAYQNFEGEIRQRINFLK